MRIGKLHFKNFRGFDDFELDLSNNRLAVFVGENGSGKSSVFNGIRFLVLKLLNEKAPFKQGDISFGKDFSDLFAELVLSLNDTAFRAEVIGKKQTADSFLDHILEISENNEDANIPIFSYYSSLKTFEEKEVEDDAFDLLEKQLKSYYRSVSSKLLRYDIFYSWFKEEEKIENDIIRNEDNNYRSTKLVAVGNALGNFLLDDNGFQMLRINRHHKERMLLKYKNRDLFFDQLSDGEKSILVLVGDIARRLTIANPSLENPLEGEGIVMIDEIDSHLHPKWQEEIVPALMRTFPNIQFLITTHSPHVVRNIQRDDLFILKDFKLEEVKPHVHGKDIGDVISEIFGQNPKHPSVEKALSQLSEMIENEELEAAKSKLKELIQQVGDEDSNVSHIRSMIDFWE